MQTDVQSMNNSMNRFWSS